MPECTNLKDSDSLNTSRSHVHSETRRQFKNSIDFPSKWYILGVTGQFLKGYKEIKVNSKFENNAANVKQKVTFRYNVIILESS